MKKQEHHSFGLDMEMFGTLLEFYLEKQKWVEWGKWNLMVGPNPSFHKCESLSKDEDLHSISIKYAQMKRNGIQYMYIYSLYKHYYIQFTFI